MNTRRRKARNAAMAIIAGLAFLGTCSTFFGNFGEKGPPISSRPVPD